MSLNLSAQVVHDSLTAKSYYEKSIELSKEFKYTASSYSAEKAAKIYAKLGRWNDYRNSYSRIFFNGHYGSDYKISIPMLKKGLSHIPTHEKINRISLNSYLGYAYNAIGDIVASVDAYETNIKPLTQLNDSIGLNLLYTNLGLGYMQFSDYAKAIFYLKYAIDLGIPNSNEVWKGIKLLGQAYYYNGDNINAKIQFKKAQSIYDPMDGTMNKFFAEIYYSEQNFEAAIKTITAAIQNCQSRPSIDSSLLVSYKKILSQIHFKNGNYTAAYDLITKILPKYNRQINKREEAKLICLLGEVCYKRRDYELALSQFQNAFKILIPEFKPNNNDEILSKDLWTREHYLPRIFNGKSKVYFQKFKSTNTLKWLLLANENAQSAIDCLQRIKLNYDETESKILKEVNTKEYYEDAIKINFELNYYTKDSVHLSNAFKIAQQANAFVLRSFINEHESLLASGVKEKDIQRLKDSYKYQNSLVKNIDNAKSHKIDSLEKILFDLKLNFNHLKDSLISKNAKYQLLRNDLEVSDVASIQKELNDYSLMLKYYKTDSLLYIFSISHDQFFVDTIKISISFDSNINAFRKSIGNMDYIKDSIALAEKNYLDNAFKLYQALLEKPLMHFDTSKINHLNIVSNDNISTIPFQVLLMSKSESWKEYTKMVVSKYSTNYYYFCKMILNKNTGIDKQNKLVSFGLEFDEKTLKLLEKSTIDNIGNKFLKENLRSDKLSRLPFSDEEAKEIAEDMNGIAWLNEEATKENFVKHTPNANIIHIATHSILNVNNANKSSLVFSKSKDTLDNLLSLVEIYNLNLQSDLVVLSACNSGFGALQNGEGLNSLARAFNMAGAPSITATLWSISDESSKKIMKLYYQNLKKGFKKDKALQKAQLEYLSNDKISSPEFHIPVYWAAWATIGNNNEVYSNESWGYEYKYFLLLFIIFFIVYFIYKKPF